MDRFEELVSAEEESPNATISNRVRLLIKNMFSNKDSGWLKTQDLNQGPKTKSQVQKEVEDKLFKEQQARDTADRDRKVGGGYNDRRNERQHRKPSEAYQEKGK